MALSPQYIASFVTGGVASLALFAVLYSGFHSSESVRADSATLQVATAAERNIDTGGRLGPLEGEFDMGLISNKEKTVKSLAIENTGDGPLNIKDVRTSCGCTKGYFQDRNQELVHSVEIAPGETAELFISVDPARVPGFDSRKTLTLFTNDPENLTASLDVTAKVEPEFEIEPEQLHLGELDKGAQGAGEAIIRQLDDANFDIAAVRAGPRAADTYTVALKPRPEEDWQSPGKREWTLRVELDSSGLRNGLFRDRIYIETNNERLKTYGYMLNAEVHAFYSVMPPMMHRRDPVDPGETNASSAVVTSDQPITIEDMTVSDPALIVAVKQEDSPNNAVLELSITEDATPGVKNATLSFAVVAADGSRAEETMRAIVAVN